VNDDYKQHLDIMLNTTAGKKVLAYWKFLVLDTSAVRDTVEGTYYALGEQEFIKNLIKTLEDPESLNEVEIEV